jgi:hypothetical protein
MKTTTLLKASVTFTFAVSISALACAIAALVTINLVSVSNRSSSSQLLPFGLFGNFTSVPVFSIDANGVNITTDNIVKRLIYHDMPIFATNGTEAVAFDIFINGTNRMLLAPTDLLYAHTYNYKIGREPGFTGISSILLDPIFRTPSIIFGPCDDYVFLQYTTDQISLFQTVSSPQNANQQINFMFGTDLANNANGKIDIDPVNNKIYISTQISGAFGSLLPIGSSDFIISRYDYTTRTIDWHRRVGTPGATLSFASVAVSTLESAYYVSGVISIGVWPGQTDFSGPDGFIAKYDASTGTQIWIVQFGASSGDDEQWYASKYSPFDDSITMISAVRGLAFGSPAIVGGYDATITKFNSTGGFKWTQQNGSPVTDTFQGIAIDHTTGDIYVTGYTNGVYPGYPALGGVNDVFMCSYTVSGTLRWCRTTGSSASDVGYGIYYSNSIVYLLADVNILFAFNSFNAALIWQSNLITTGTTNGWGLELYNGALYVYQTSTGNYAGNIYRGGTSDVILSKINPSNGVAIWNFQIGTSGTDTVSTPLYPLLDAAEGKMFIVGHSSGVFQNTTNAGSTDIFIVELSCI